MSGTMRFYIQRRLSCRGHEFKTPEFSRSCAAGLCYIEGMGRQWLHAKRAVASVKKAQATGKIVREMMVAARMGGPDPAGNARLAAAVEKARKESVSRDVIERAIKKGAGVGGEKLVMEHVVFEGYTLHKVPV